MKNQFATATKTIGMCVICRTPYNNDHKCKGQKIERVIVSMPRWGWKKWSCLSLNNGIYIPNLSN